ncbi:MAG: hypothetical protein WC080_01180 [Patescibacteria group bacterium]
MFERLKQISKRKLILYAGLFVFVLLASGSIAAAKFGYFPKLANVLHIKADTIAAWPQTYTVCNAGRAEFNGYYTYTGTNDTSEGNPGVYYRMDSNHTINLIDYPWSGQRVWSVTNYGFLGYESGAWNNSPPPEGTWGTHDPGTYGNSATIKVGKVDPATCSANMGILHGQVTSYVDGVQKNLDGVTINVLGSNDVVNILQTTVVKTATTSGTTLYNYSISDIPVGNYTVTAYKAGYNSQPTSRSVTISSGATSEANFIMASTASPKPIVNLKTAGGASAVTMQRGTTTSLTWTITNATLSLCTASPSGWWNNTLSGSANISPLATTIYSLTCTSSAGSGSGSVNVTVSDPTPNPTTPTLNATLTATPTSGTAPLSDTLTATASGTATGTLNYTFWWNCDNQGNFISSIITVCGDPADSRYGVKFDNVTDLTKTVSHTYTDSGTFKPKVIIERDVLGATAVAQVVADPAATEPNTFKAQGRVVMKGTGELISGIGVDIQLSGTDKHFNTTSQAASIDANNGANYKIADIPISSDSYKVTYTIPGYLKFLNNTDSIRIFRKSEIINGVITLPDLSLDIYYLGIKVAVKDGTYPTSPVLGAQVTVFDRGCSYLNVPSKITDPQGKAYFYSQDIFDYLAWKFHGCAPVPMIKVTKVGYYDFIGYPNTRGDETIVNLQRAQTLDREIKVQVLDQDSKPIVAAQVNVRRNISDENPISKNTDTSGYASFTNVTGVLTVDAFKTGYLQNSSSRITLDVGLTGKISITLSLQKYITSGLPASIMVADSKTLKAIGDAEVTLNGQGVVQTKITDWLGKANFSFELGKTYTAKATKNGASKTQSFTIPQNYFSLTLDQQKDFAARNLLMLLDTGQSEFSPVPIKVIDESGKRIAGATVVNKLNNYYFSNLGFTDAAYIGTSSSGLDLKLKNDFSLYESYSSYLQPNRTPISPPAGIVPQGFAEGQPLDLMVLKQGYKLLHTTAVVEKDVETQQPKVIVLTLQKAPALEAQAGIYVYNYDYFKDCDYTDLYLEKKTADGSWSKTADKAFLAVNDFGEETAKFVPTSAGTYRVGINKHNAKSPPVEFTPGYDNWTRLGDVEDLCSPDDNSLLKDYGDGIYMIFKPKTIYGQHSSIFDEAAQSLRRLKSQSKDVRPVVIGFLPMGKIEGYQWNGMWNCAKIGKDVKPIIFSTELLDFSLASDPTGADVGATIAHEYGHAVNEKIRNSTPSIYAPWNDLYNRVMAGPDKGCVMGAITDSNVELMPGDTGGHPWDNDNEFFASFYWAYFMQHGRLHGIIRDHTTGTCQNIMKYMWQWFADNVGRVDPDDGQVFKSVGGSVTGIPYTYAQISNGSWIQSTYDKLPLSQKVSIQYQRILAPVISSVRATVVSAIQTLNNWADSALAALHITNLGSVQGTLRSASDSTILANYVIQIGPKAAITNGQGYFIIRNIPSGSQLISSIRQRGTGKLCVNSRPTGINILTGRMATTTIRCTTQAAAPPASLAVTLNATPSSLIVNNTQTVALTSNVTGGATGTKTYSYYCKIGNTTPVRVLKDTPTLSGVCTYTAAGTYTAKVTVQDSAGVTASATTPITVTNP